MARNGIAGTILREELAPLDAILRTEELQRRPRRRPDYETENRALAALVQALADSPRTILQTLADTILDVCHADSAGMSLLTNDAKSFEWAAIAGAWKPHLGGGTPRDFGPCGDVLDRNQALLFTHWEQRYPYLSAAVPLAEEGLLVPFYIGGKAVGTIWAITHRDTRKFDSEDLRVLESLGRFASAAYQTLRLRDADDARRAALNVMEDAVEARRAVDRLNAGLAAGEQRLKDILAALPAAVYTTDAEGRITFYNKAAVALAGREPKIGSDRWCVSWKLHWPDGRPLPHDQCPMAVALKENRPISGVEAVAERPDGTRVPFMPFPTPLHDANGKLIGGINMLIDISARKQAEEARARLAAIVESSDDAIVSKSLEGIIATWNKGAERLLGYTAQEAIGRSITMIIPPERLEEEPKILARLRRGEAVDHMETVRVRKDGSPIQLSLTISPIRDQKGAVIGASKIARDITQRKQAEQKERAQKKILEMVATGKPLDEILDTLMLLVEAQEPGMRCGILLVADDGAHFRRGSGPHLPEAYHAALDGVPITPPYLGSCGEAAHRGAAIVMPDIGSETRYADEWRALMSSCGIRAGRSTPVRGSDGCALGSLAMYFDSPRDPNPADPELVDMAANLAAIAIERDRAAKSVHQQLHEMQRLHAFSRQLLMHDDIDAMMRVLLIAVAELMHVNKATVQICDGRNPPLRLVDALGFDQAFSERFQTIHPDGFTTCAVALRRRERVIVEDLDAAPEFAQTAEAARPYGIKAAQSTPLLDRSGFVVAMLTTYFDRPYRPTERELQLLDVYAELAARQIERKRHLEHREMLMNELNHRVKNTLATVQSITAQTLRRAASPAEARNAIESRLVALSKTHNVLTREHWEGADIQELMSGALAAYFTGDHARRLQVAGGPMRLTPKAALTLSMALHELATNAVKYGALSNETGHVRIEWNVAEGGRPAFRLQWSESDGPPVSPPRRRGFGSRLIEQGLAHDLAGEVRLDFRQQGLVCTIEAPLGEVVGGGGAMNYEWLR